PRAQGQGVVLFDPLPNRDHHVVLGAGADDHLLQPGVDNHPAAHGAGGGVGEDGAGGGVLPRQVQGTPHHVPPGGGDDGVGLGVDAAAQLVPLSPGDPHGLPGAVAQIHAVSPAPGRPVVAGGDDLVVLDNDGAVAPAQTGGPADDRLGDVQVVVLLTDALHGG